MRTRVPAAQPMTLDGTRKLEGSLLPGGRTDACSHVGWMPERPAYELLSRRFILVSSTVRQARARDPLSSPGVSAPGADGTVTRGN
jgi:hypothetical protein